MILSCLAAGWPLQVEGRALCALGRDVSPPAPRQGCVASLAIAKVIYTSWPGTPRVRGELACPPNFGWEALPSTQRQPAPAG